MPYTSSSSCHVHTHHPLLAAVSVQSSRLTIEDLYGRDIHQGERIVLKEECREVRPRAIDVLPRESDQGAFESMHGQSEEGQKMVMFRQSTIFWQRPE